MEDITTVQERVNTVEVPDLTLLTTALAELGGAA